MSTAKIRPFKVIAGGIGNAASDRKRFHGNRRGRASGVRTLRMGKPTPRLSDVARVAAVSLATASRALTSPDQVRPATVAKVKNAAQMLGYVAHGAARALASKRSRTIGAVIPTLDNAIFAASVNALQSSLAESGFHLLLATDSYDLRLELDVARALIERGVDGILFVGGDHDADLYRLVRTSQIPYVLIMTMDRSLQHPTVGFDNRQAAMLVTRHLLDLGHRRIGVITGATANNDRARDRVVGVRDARNSRGYDLPADAIVEKAYSFESGRDGIRQLMKRSVRLTAIVCTNDVLALGALLECQAMGMRVPVDMSITGFDDMDLAAQIPPGITSVHFSTQEQGRLAATYLIDSISGRSVAKCTEVPVELIVRGSSAPPTT